MKYKEAKARAEILKALAHPVRVLIVDRLTLGEQCVSELSRLARINQSNISRHLATLKKVGIIADRRVGMNVFYRLQTPSILKTFDCALDVIKSDGKRRIADLKIFDR
jgi:DNA-binding transcriptional ArsR family regulator